MASFHEKLEFACKKLHLSYKLKEKQTETLEQLYIGNDCISVLPTGYGKSVIYQLLPWLMQKNGKPGIVIVVCPLTSIMHDQVMSLSLKGVNAAFLNIKTSVCHTFDEDKNEGADEENDMSDDDSGDNGDLENKLKLLCHSIDKVKAGEIELLYCHPESLFTPEMSSILRSKIYQEMISCIAIDEVHMVTEW